jgi:hypothetical protein
MNVTKELAQKVLETVDAGLCTGVGVPTPGHMCVEAAVCYAMGLPHGDEPTCVAGSVRSHKISLNDSKWSSKQARAKGMRRLAIAQLGSEGVVDDGKFTIRVAELVVRKQLPAALRAAVSWSRGGRMNENVLEDAARMCETGRINEATCAAVEAATAAQAFTVREAAQWARRTTPIGSLHAVRCAAASIAMQTDPNDGEAFAKAQDKAFADFAEGVVQILIEMKSPGCEFLSLTEGQ